MKNLSILLMALLVIFISCKKGNPGPEGPPGLAGPQGVQGNANIRQYSFGVKTVTSGTFDDTLTNISKGFIDSSLVLAYFSVSSTWYPVPGLGASGNYSATYFLFQDNPNPSNYIMRFNIYQPNTVTPYTSSFTWDKVKIIVAPASILTVVGRVITVEPKQPLPDFSNYYDVCKFYNLQP